MQNSKHDNGFRSPETIRELESQDPTNMPADMVEGIGGNPHAETIPVCWREDPGAWIYHHFAIEEQRSQYGASPRETETILARAFVACVEALDSVSDIPNMEETEADKLALLFRLVSNHLCWRVGAGTAFFPFGPLAIPTSPHGFAFAKRVREFAREHIQTNRLECVDPQSQAGALLAALKEQDSAPRSGLLERTTNTTRNTVPEKELNMGQTGFRLELAFHSRSLESMPNGTTLPPALLKPELDGFEVSDPIELQRECDMCDDGTADFLERFGIGFEREGSYECGECGCEHENDECGTIESVDSFTLTSDMVEAIDSQGFGDKLREYAGACDDNSDSLSALLESCDDSEILERVAPDSENGIRFDPSVWGFTPDFDALESAEDLETSEALRAGALLGSITNAHTSAGLLPPIPGTLSYNPLSYERNMRNSALSAIAFEWCPDKGTLTSALGGNISLRVDARTGARVLVLADPMRGPNSTRTVPLEPNGSTHALHMPQNSTGERAGLLLQTARARVEV